ncbi:hypothetical protein [Helicobacter pullorum]|uniref:hypothetical protein n=1 Tax=Helicobacter pullorum TaxID=35818 RepID=UPI002432D17D|nr:hypothetical protein [Helicobacter pullorum]
MKQYEIRVCRQDEYIKLIDFIQNHWKKDHIFVKSKAMLDFQHLDSQNSCYNFIVAHNANTQEFDAILGFIPLSHYDRNLCYNDFWLAIWKVKEESKKSGIGLEVLLYFINTFNPRSVAAIGISAIAERVYKAYGWHIGTLGHFYIKNTHKERFSIATFIGNSQEFKRDSNLSINFCEITNLGALTDTLHTHMPTKSLEFFKNRYVYHPVYTYKIYGIFDTNTQKCLALFVFRAVFVENACCLRIVDYLGEFVPQCYEQFQNLLESHNAEYIDMLCYTPNIQQILQMGFTQKQENEIVPNHFEPFVKGNVEIHFAYKSTGDSYMIFKGDSDQDRPNFV